MLSVSSFPVAAWERPAAASPSEASSCHSGSGACFKPAGKGAYG